MALNQIFHKNALIDGTTLILLIGAFLVAGGAFGHDFKVLDTGLATVVAGLGLGLTAFLGSRITKQIQERKWKEQSAQQGHDFAVYRWFNPISSKPIG